MPPRAPSQIQWFVDRVGYELHRMIDENTIDHFKISESEDAVHLEITSEKFSAIRAVPKDQIMRSREDLADKITSEMFFQVAELVIDGMNASELRAALKPEGD